MNGAGRGVDQVDSAWKAEADEVMRKAQCGGRGQPIATVELRRLPCETTVVAADTRNTTRQIVTWFKVHIRHYHCEHS